MSRLIVKNLPEKIKETRLRDLFSCQGGEITDVKLCFTKRGVFRKFAFIGYKNDKDALSTLQFLDKTFIDTNKIQVEVCKDLGDQSVPRPWSKHAKGSSAFQRKTKEIDERKERIKKLQEDPSVKIKKKKEPKQKVHVLKELSDVQDDPEFQEFLAAHSVQSKKQTWTNENVVIEKTVDKEKPSWSNEDLITEDAVDDIDSEDDMPCVSKSEEKIHEPAYDDNSDRHDSSVENMEQGDEIIPKKKSTHSDLDWLKSKVTKTKGESTPSQEATTSEIRHQDSAEEDINATKKKKEKKKKNKKKKKEVNDGETKKEIDNLSDNESEQEECIEANKKKRGASEDEKEPTSLTIKMRGIPFKCTEEDVINFFKPCCIQDIRFQKNLEGRPTGYAFVDFASKNDVKIALKKDQSKMKGRYIELFVVVNKKADESDAKADQKWLKKNKDADESPDDVSDSGRLFIRNLSYTCTDDDLQTLFSKYGPLVEVNVPVDKNSNRSTGYAFVTFMMPEHAVKALSELDGNIFQGRLLHLLPGHTKKSKADDEPQGAGTSQFKMKKEQEQKALSGSSHNWNALFLGQNAIADVMASRLNTTKSGILDAEAKGSVAVRMALGETELVSETREFLESHGVKLDVFGQAKSARSKNIMLAKNLPPGTTENELKEIFEKYGDLGQLLMPPFGITAIIEFVQSKNAKEAFSNLAYSKFKHTPLYLEWAPVDILTGEVSVKKEEEQLEDGDKDDSENEASGSEVTGNVIFVKNLNFDTTEDKLRERFINCGKLKNVTVAKKKDPKKPEHLLSMGYGFVEFKRPESAEKAIKLLQHCDLDGHKLELKMSHRETIAPKTSRKRALEKKQASSKIIVRNVPFEATTKEIRELFSSFGTLKTVRLPKKMAGTGSHRGFAFVDFTTKQEAKRAFKALCQSTHLYGRRLVLEWADEEDSVELLRKKTAEHYHESSEPHTKKRKNDILTSLEKSTVDTED